MKKDRETKKKVNDSKKPITKGLTVKQEFQRQQMLKESHVAIGRQRFYEGTGVDESDDTGSL